MSTEGMKDELLEDFLELKKEKIHHHCRGIHSSSRISSTTSPAPNMDATMDDIQSNMLSLTKLGLNQCLDFHLYEHLWVD
jgi:hypothetical protein